MLKKKIFFFTPEQLSQLYPVHPLGQVQKYPKLPNLLHEPVLQGLGKHGFSFEVDFIYSLELNNVNKPIEVLLIIWYEMTLTDKKSTKMSFYKTKLWFLIK